MICINRLAIFLQSVVFSLIIVLALTFCFSLSMIFVFTNLDKKQGKILSLEEELNKRNVQYE